MRRLQMIQGEVDILGGAPGVFSSPLCSPAACDTDNLTKLLKDIANIPEKDLSARFHCVIAYVTPTLVEPVVVHGVWEGSLVHKPQGNNGFGYDPIFMLAEEKCTSAQLSSKQKNQLSHRMQTLSPSEEYLNKADVWKFL
ncbi:MAG: non-canonical purine NTP pyrophosphatase [Candidatus Oxydemutatoraceae bacterium WSBS_2016_MAG_OTU14]